MTEYLILAVLILLALAALGVLAFMAALLVIALRRLKRRDEPAAMGEAVDRDGAKNAERLWQAAMGSMMGYDAMRAREAVTDDVDRDFE